VPQILPKARILPNNSETGRITLRWCITVHTSVTSDEPTGPQEGTSKTLIKPVSDSRQ
jgi:hypothetical protein